MPRRSIWKLVGVITAEVLLIALTVAMIAAILLPVHKGTSTDGSDRDAYGAPVRRR
jgi:hypothetical protein